MASAEATVPCSANLRSVSDRSGAAVAPCWASCCAPYWAAPPKARAGSGLAEPIHASEVMATESGTPSVGLGLLGRAWPAVAPAGPAHASFQCHAWVGMMNWSGK